MTLYRVERRPGGVRIFDDNDEQVAIIEIPPGTDMRRVLEAAGWRIVRSSSQSAGQVFVQRVRRRP